MIEESTSIEILSLSITNATSCDYLQFLSDLRLPKLRILDIALEGDGNMHDLIELGMLREIPSFNIHVQPEKIENINTSRIDSFHNLSPIKTLEKIWKVSITEYCSIRHK